MQYRSCAHTQPGVCCERERLLVLCFFLRVGPVCCCVVCAHSRIHAVRPFLAAASDPPSFQLYLKFQVLHLLLDLASFRLAVTSRHHPGTPFLPCSAQQNRFCYWWWWLIAVSWSAVHSSVHQKLGYRLFLLTWIHRPSAESANVRDEGILALSSLKEQWIPWTLQRLRWKRKEKQLSFDTREDNWVNQMFSNSSTTFFMCV